MTFTSAAENSKREKEARVVRGLGALRYGISFLDDALGGILKSDLVLIGAPSGVGKTELCCNIASANLDSGKKVSYIALEAERFEIESRIKFKMISQMFFADQERPRLSKPFKFPNWYKGELIQELEKYEAIADNIFSQAYGNLNIIYKPDTFGIEKFVEVVLECSDKTDLIIVDHVHYFDLDDDNENKAMKQIAKTARALSLENGKPIVLVAHLRKRDRANADMVPDMDEFHGSSDLSKIATRVITFAPGTVTTKGNFETFFRIPKNRIDGGVTRFIGRMIYSQSKGMYEEGYRIGLVYQKRGECFEELPPDLYPEWFRRRDGGSGDLCTERNKTLPAFEQRKTGYENYARPYREY